MLHVVEFEMGSFIVTNSTGIRPPLGGNSVASQSYRPIRPSYSGWTGQRMSSQQANWMIFRTRDGAERYLAEHRERIMEICYPR